MNLVRFFGTRGIRIYIGMNAIDLIQALDANSLLYNEVPKLADLKKSLVSAVYLRQTAEELLEKEEAALEAAKVKAAEYDRDMTRMHDDFDCAVQTSGNFKGDSPSLIPGIAIPLTGITKLYSQLRSKDLVYKYTEQITTVMQIRKSAVERAKRHLESARELEASAVKETVSLMLLVHV